jgi:glutamine synthetase
MDEITSFAIEQVKKRITEQNIQMIDLKFIDLQGKIRRVTLPVSNFDECLFTEGIGFDGSSVGFKSVKSGDMCLIPDLHFIFMDPFWDHPTLSMFCRIVEADTRSGFIGDPRSVASRALTYLLDQKIAQEMYILPELEFNFFDDVSYRNQPHDSFFKLHCQESYAQSNDDSSYESGFWIPHQSGYHAAFPNDSYANIRAEVVMLAENAGVKIKYHHHEVGASGQQEIELNMCPMLIGCDHVTLTKYFLRNTAIKHGLMATFMPKPLLGDAGNGMHIHFRLVGQDNNPVFFDENDEIGLSETAYCFMGGVIAHGESLTAFTNPSTNSFRRLVRGYEAPTSLFFSVGSRNSAIRIPKYATAPDKKRFELRSPDATCNIYFATSAIIMAGIDGIKQGIHAKKEGWGPFSDTENLSKKSQSEIRQLPESLAEALEVLRKDHKYLLAGDVFTEPLINGWIDSKYARDINFIKQTPTPLEFELYFNC